MTHHPSTQIDMMPDFESALRIRVEALLQRDVLQASSEPFAAAKRILECTHRSLNSETSLAQLASDLHECGYCIGDVTIQDCEWHYNRWCACVSRVFPPRRLPYLPAELPKCLISKSFAALLAHVHLRRQGSAHKWKQFLELAGELERDWNIYARICGWAPLQKNSNICILVGAAMRILADLGKRISLGWFKLDSSELAMVRHVCRQYREYTGMAESWLEDPGAMLIRVSSSTVQFGERGLCARDAAMESAEVQSQHIMNVKKMLTGAWSRNRDVLCTDSERYQITGIAFDVIQSIVALEQPRFGSRECYCSLATVCCNIIEVGGKDNSLMVLLANIYLCCFFYRMGIGREYITLAGLLWHKWVRPQLHHAYPWFTRDSNRFYEEVCEACARIGHMSTHPGLFDESDCQLEVIKSVCQHKPWLETELQNTANICFQLAFFNLLSTWVDRKQLEGELRMAPRQFGQESDPNQQGKRIALLIGQRNYPGRETSGFTQLNAAHNDVDEMAESLELCGFDVVLRFKDRKASHFDMFATLLLQLLGGEPDSFVLFYYAGHAFSLSGNTMLVPIDASSDNQETYVKLNEVLQPLHDSIGQRDAGLGVRTASEHSARCAPGTQVFVMLDACRERLREPPGSSSVSHQSLTNASSDPLRPDPICSQFIYLYACDTGEVARENEKHGFLTEAFLYCLETPNLGLWDLLGKTIAHCNDESRRNCQRPWFYSCLRSGNEIILNRGRLASSLERKPAGEQ